ncbi:hypothetical protein WJX73_002149 [Symbiochloris irregularis]|uniref:Pyruvate phosphate dikinase AMP/ATP-binding domain-containing protein n=1 Tax=Symbiochloris irregularis TaxID=706552 RepID=A0AAW1P3M8_9CHLO
MAPKSLLGCRDAALPVACFVEGRASSNRCGASSRRAFGARILPARPPAALLGGCTRSVPLGCRTLRLSHSGTERCRTPAAVAERMTSAEPIFSASYDSGVSTIVNKEGSQYVVDISLADPKPAVLHWAVNDWNLPPQEHWPAGTNQIDEKAIQSPFSEGGTLRLVFNEASCPRRVVFVLKQTAPENWINNGGGDFSVQIKAPGLDDVADKIYTAEGTYTHWSLFNRFCLANELLDAADAVGPEGMALIMVWLRLSTSRQLPWYKNSSYQSKDIAHVQKTIAQRMADKARESRDPECRLFARLGLAGLPRGGGDGDAIRMGILHIMRENGIREGHRPGIEDHFIEQWHQKLHTNTTPEDITICEGYLAFLHSGDWGDFWRVLWDNGRITRDMLATMDHPITATPVHLPQLIGPFQHYLWILKTTHSGADMDVALEMAKGSLDGDLQWNLFDLLSHRDAWWVPGKLVDLRARLRHYREAPGASRDVLLLDIALDNYLRLLVERMEKSSLSGDDLCELTSMVMRNALVTFDSEDFSQCQSLWEKVKAEERWSKEWGIRALAAVQRTSVSLAAFGDRMYLLTQPFAERFQRECGVDFKYVQNFGEEVVRGQPVFTLSALLQHLEPMLRNSAGVGSWQVVSQAEAQGRVVVLDSLSEVQGISFPGPTIVVARHVGGMEDIPEEVQAVLTGSSVDVLSHVAIRARTQKVLLASCYEEWQLDAVRGHLDKGLSLTVDPTGAVNASPLDASSGTSAGGPIKGGSPDQLQPLRIPKPRGSTQWALAESDFAEGVVGGKSGNLAKLRGALPDWINVPTSVAVPFGSCERALKDGANAEVAEAIEAAQRELDAAARGEGMPPALHTLQTLVATQLQPPSSLASEIATAAESAGLVPKSEWAEGTRGWDQAWSAIRGVWASKWNERAWLSRRARGVKDSDLFMACLLQQVVPAEYAFVLHTAHPVTGAKGELFGEVVVGLGEALVGNYPGRALSFRAASPGNGNSAVEVLSLFSKRSGLFVAGGPTVIARSDSNGEDLEAFAGAGLYDSIPLRPLQARPVDYASERLFWDTAFQSELLGGMVQLGKAVEKAFEGVPQDIEGLWADGKFTVVQSRPQVL